MQNKEKQKYYPLVRNYGGSNILSMGQMVVLAPIPREDRVDIKNLEP